jgi:hypothetical protein
MAACFGVFITFSEAKVNDIDDVLVFTGANEEVIWLDVTMQESVLMYIFYPLKLSILGEFGSVTI